MPIGRIMSGKKLELDSCLNEKLQDFPKNRDSCPEYSSVCESSFHSAKSPSKVISNMKVQSSQAIRTSWVLEIKINRNM